MPTLTTKNNRKQQLLFLNINELNSEIKRHRLTDWLHKQDPTFCCLQETHLRGKRQTLPQRERLGNNFPSKWSEETNWSSHSNI
jgi:exonuclease III